MTYITGETIKTLREKKGFTQKQLAQRLAVTDKAVSKWETNRGFPDVGILQELAETLSVSIPELLTGEVACNRNVSANMKRSKFYVCPLCGNVVHAMGEGAFSCCGILLPAEQAEEPDVAHKMSEERVDCELFVQVDHPMTKKHFISFIAYATDDSIQMKKLYPEQEAQARFVSRGAGLLYIYCNRDGLFVESVKRS